MPGLQRRLSHWERLICWRVKREFRPLGKYLTWPMILQTIQGARQQRLAGLAAEIAYNAMLSLFPAIFALLAALSFFDLHNPSLRGLARQFAEVAPLDVVLLIRNFVEKEAGQGVFTLSFLVTLWVSSNAIAAAMAAMDQIQQVPFRQRRPFWRARLVAILLTCGSLFLYVLAGFFIFVSEFAIRYLAAQSGPAGTRLLALWWMLNRPIALGMIVLAIIFLYRFGSSQRQPGTPIVPGALVAALAWAVLSVLFRTYILEFGTYRQVYGTLGTAIIMLLWLYLSAWGVLIGYQFNVTIAHKLERLEVRSAIGTQSLNPKRLSPGTWQRTLNSTLPALGRSLSKAANPWSSTNLSTENQNTDKTIPESEASPANPNLRTHLKSNFHLQLEDRKIEPACLLLNPKPKI